jgi:hypothetical protein
LNRLAEKNKKGKQMNYPTIRPGEKDPQAFTINPTISTIISNNSTNELSG